MQIVEGLEQFFAPGSEILVAENTADALAAINLSDRELKQVAEAARARALAEHTAESRAAELERLLTQSYAPEMTA